MSTVFNLKPDVDFSNLNCDDIGLILLLKRPTAVSFEQCFDHNIQIPCNVFALPDIFYPATKDLGSSPN